MKQKQCTLRSSLHSARVAINNRDVRICDFTEKVCTDYSLLTCAQDTIYRDGLNVTLAGTQMRGKHFGGCRVTLSGNGQKLQFGNPDCKIKQMVQSPSRRS